MELLLTPITIGLLAGLGVLLIWTGFLSYQFLSLKKHYNQLLGKGKKAELQDVLKQILQAQNRQFQTINELQTQVKSHRKDSTYHLQLVGFKRFNPFRNTGGQQSFALALLDKHKSGIVISSFHNREVTRVYTKEVVRGKEKDVNFSEEEKEVVAKAKVVRA